jgi:antitoxin component of MazEF toxin-antitoxin module
MLEELSLKPGAEVEVTSEGTSIRVRRVEQSPPDDLIEFAHRFTKKYEVALRNLAQR